MKRVYVLTDLEGVGGVEQWDPHTYGLPNADALKRQMVELLAGEVNAAIEGALAAGVEEILVRDGHGLARNLEASSLHPAAVLLQGTTPGSWLPGFDASIDALLFVGQHAREGAPNSVLAHSWSGVNPKRCYLNESEVGEIAAAVMIARWYGAPTVFLSGDHAAVEEVLDVEPGVSTVETKHARVDGFVEHLPVEECRALIAAGVERALGRGRDARPARPVPPFRFVEVFLRPPYCGVPFLIGRMFGRPLTRRLLLRAGRWDPRGAVRSRFRDRRSIEHTGASLPDVLHCGLGCVR